MWGKPEKVEERITCSLVKAPDVYIEPIPRSKISILMGEYPHQEWLAYLSGRLSEQGNIFVEDISIPPHSEASGASAEAEPFHTPTDCVGVIHSHHGMGAFHSGTDQNFVDKNFPVSITVARDKGGTLQFDAVSYQHTPCGKSMTLKAGVKYVQPQPAFEKDEFLKEAKKNIDKGKIAYKYHAPAIATGTQKFLPYSGYTDYVTDDKGNVLSTRELARIMADIYKD